MKTLLVGKRIFTVLQTEDTAEKYPAIFANGWSAIVTALLGKTVFQIYQKQSGKSMVIRAFV